MDPRTKRISLEFIGEGWQDCYIDLRFLRWDDYKRLDQIDRENIKPLPTPSAEPDDQTDPSKAKSSHADAESEGDGYFEAMVQKIELVFHAGQVLENGKPVPLSKEGIRGFDLDTLTILRDAVLGRVSPKESNSSAPTTESTPTP